MLAIVIPAYKSDFLSLTLDSISKQSNTQFHLYIGDDASPDNIKEIVTEYQSKLSLEYTRFSSNIGHNSLTKHWERCIALSKDEPYIWLFSDDDIMPPDAVERFYKTIAENREQEYLYRFNLMAIDQNNRPVYTYKTKPTYETNYDYVINRLKGKYLSSVVDFIFSRNTYEKNEGFVEFPHAWCSDDATWISFSENKDIYTIPGDPIQWRISGKNISSNIDYGQNLVPVLLTYSKWLLSFFKPKPTNHIFLNSLYLNIIRQTKRLKGSFNLTDYRKVFKLFKSHYGLIGLYSYVIAWLFITWRNIKALFVGYLKSLKCL